MPGMFFYVNKDTGEMQREVQHMTPRRLRRDDDTTTTTNIAPTCLHLACCLHCNYQAT